MELLGMQLYVCTITVIDGFFVGGGIWREIPGGPRVRAARCLLNRGESVSVFSS
jgi:hypothetical protein